jgi:hypothetical protein
MKSDRIDRVPRRVTSASPGPLIVAACAVAMAMTEPAGNRVAAAEVVPPTPVPLAPAVPTIIVDESVDSNTGSCDTLTPGRCNLRAAVTTAMKTEGESRIILNVNSTITLGEISIFKVTPIQDPHITIQGSITGLRRKVIAGSGTSRLFNVSGNSFLVLSNLEVSGFSVTNDPSDEFPTQGGAILNDGILLLQDAVLANNSVVCSASDDFMAAVSCSGGAIVNHGQLSVAEGGAVFADNKVVTQASAQFASAFAGGGAIFSDGFEISLFGGPVLFRGNVVEAVANGGVPGGKSSARAEGGAINSSGLLVVSDGAVGACSFENNAADVTATDPEDTVSRGGAIFAIRDFTDIPQGACTFSGNRAKIDPDVHLE